MSRRPSIRHASGRPRPARGLLPLAALASGPVLILALLVTSPPRAHAAVHPQPTGPAAVSLPSPDRAPAADERNPVRDGEFTDGCPAAGGRAPVESGERPSRLAHSSQLSRRHLLGEVGPGVVPADCTGPSGSRATSTYPSAGTVVRRP
ncbi:hypothetical protein AB0I52_22470 [Streptomyces sp. NPDC050423]|uniref:hypothetical protein n=1 Tax=Streptomyces sp. NPDC050423 TaxID=3155402 RepID=UPI003424E7E2